MGNTKNNDTDKAISSSDTTSSSQVDSLRSGSVQPKKFLRKQAEEILRKRLPLALEDLEAMPSEETLHIIQELQVHQVELEIQNEELRRAQVELATIRARYFDLYDLAPVGYLTINPQGVILESNLTATILLGAPRSILVGMPISGFILKEYQDAYYFFCKQLLETGAPQFCELLMAKNDTTTFWAQLHAANACDFTGMSECQIVLCDISKTRQTEEDFARAQEVGSIGSWRIDVRKNMLTWSDENYRIFGISKGTPLSYETFLSIVHPEDRMYVDTQWQAGLRGEPYDIEHRIVVGAQVKWVREKAYLEFDKNNTLAGGFGITQDITERKLTEEVIKRQNDELRDQNKTLEVFNEAAVGRELRMIELKQEINELCRQVGQPSRYPVDWEEVKS